ncbi:MAG: polyprenyl synthetase family protein [Clostridia bacterium]|nr:polyprenyl synthetase family protein [Clostridia bacterium]
MEFWKDYNGLGSEIEYVKNIIKENLSDSPLYMKDIINHILEAKGKFIRAALVIESASLGKSDFKRVAEIAAAIEILHLATLIHDDIIDEAIMRRGTESIQHRYGKDKAVVCGDYLFAKSFSLLSSDYQEHMKYLSKGVEKICLGEIYQQTNRFNTQLTVRQYLRTISGKTAALFAMCLYAGGLEAKLKKAQLKNLIRCGYAMGMSFQIIDDCLDYNGTDLTIGKSAKKDLLQGYYTLPLIYAIDNDQNEVLSEKLELLAEESFELDKIIQLVNQLDGVVKSKAVAEKYINRADKYLMLVDDKENIIKLRKLMQFLLKRNY